MSIESKCTIGAMASKKASASSPVSAAMRLGEGGGGERAGRDDDAVPLRGRQAGDFGARDRRSADGRRAPRSRAAKSLAVDGERAAGGNLVGVGRRMMSEPAGASPRAGGRRRWLGGRRSGRNWSRRVRRGRRSCAPRWSARAHLVEHDGHAASRRSARRPRAGEAAADDMDRLHECKSRLRVGLCAEEISHIGHALTAMQHNFDI
jgi:hypothetical protein